MKVSMPKGRAHGWGIAGEYLSREIGKLPPVDGVTLHGIRGVDLMPIIPENWGRLNIGYTFFENDIDVLDSTRRAARQWDYIVAGSKWCEQHLRIGGVQNTCTILQGIDPQCFEARPPRKDDGSFVVFSGGKFEFRKSQDLVIASMKVLMERHRDVRLRCAWYNQWAFSMATMAASPHITFRQTEEECLLMLYRTLAENGIPLDRVDLYPILDNAQMADAYADSDIGLFPNRCEGGNNMVMCEYMACGRPVIASDITGHADVITEQNAFPLTSYRPFVVEMKGRRTGVWFEPDLEEIIELLEFSYRYREAAASRGVRAAEDMRRLSWEEAARSFHQIGVRLIEEQGERRQYATSPSLTGSRVLQELADRGGEAALAGDLRRAESLFRQVILLAPSSSEGHYNLGTALAGQGRHCEATGCYHRAALLRRDFAPPLFNMGNSFREIGNQQEAVNCYRRAAEIDPSCAEAFYNLGCVLQEQGERDEAITSYRLALAARHDFPEAWHNLGDLLQEKGDLHEAVSCYRHSLNGFPERPGTLASLGNALQGIGDFAGACDCYRRALILEPENEQIRCNLAVSVASSGRLEEAICLYRDLLAGAPGYADAHWNLALALLAKGDFRDGWQEYEWRARVPGIAVQREFRLPRWGGDDPAGRSILLVAEQGIGDTLQFVRYAPLLAQRGARVLLECQAAGLASLLSRMPDVAGVVECGTGLPPCDCYEMLMSLPRLFGTTVETIPAGTPYLVVDPERAAAFKERLDHASGLKIGIAWSGRQTVPRNRRRSCGLAAFAPLAEIPGVAFYSLQIGEGREEAHNPPDGMKLVDLTAHIADFDDTAALIDLLDLVISIDTSVAHLAGALGKEVWTLLPASADWRWLADRDDSPWYPSMRLFRQREWGDWAGVMSEVRSALEMKVKERAGGGCGELMERGLSLRETGRKSEAEAIFRQALDLSPHDPEILNNLGVVLDDQGRYREAINCFTRVLALQKGHLAASFNLARAWLKLGEPAEAEVQLRILLRQDPEFLRAALLLAEILAGRGQSEEAILLLGEQAAMHPGEAEPSYRMGHLYREGNQHEEAAKHYLRVLELMPAHAGAFNNLGLVREAQHDFAAAERCLRQALALAPANSGILTNLGAFLYKNGKKEEGLERLREAVTANPRNALAHYNFGYTNELEGKWQDAIACYCKAVELKPDYADAHYNLALALLLTGNFREGWREHDWRWEASNFSSRRRVFPVPCWDGSPLEGRTILLDFEQGAGDMIQFIRYARLVAERGGKVLVMCPPRLKRIFSTVPGISALKVDGEAWGEFHASIPLMELPRIFDTTLETIPGPNPYISALPEDFAAWRDRLSGYPGVRAGIVWAGNPLHRNDCNRSCKPADLAPLADLDGVSFFSLQVGNQSAEADCRDAGVHVIDLTASLGDYADTAALIANLDLVIAVDTSVAHLAGAMGKPTWLLLPVIPDWRWLLEREDSPWYPSMRLFRQRTAGDWREVMLRVRDELIRLCNNKDAGKV